MRDICTESVIPVVSIFRDTLIKFVLIGCVAVSVIFF